MNIRANKEYWDNRAKTGETPHELVLNDVYLEEFEQNTKLILSLFKDKKVLDVGCGYGRLSDIFEDYKGIDFSDGMIELARQKYPNKNFQVAKDDSGTYDVIFECMSLSSFDETPEQFRDRFKDKAKIIMTLEPKEFRIYYI